MVDSARCLMPCGRFVMNKMSKVNKNTILGALIASYALNQMET